MFKLLSIINSILALILLPYGSLVRLTGSGLACPDWPLCYDKLIPHFNIHIFYEVSHRYLASVVTIIVFILLILSYVKSDYKKYRFYTTAIFLTILLQATMGGLTVIYGLHPATVVGHLVLGNICLCLLIGLSSSFFIKVKLSPNLKPTVISAAALFLVTIFFGGLNSGYLAGYSCNYFPLCSKNSPGFLINNGSFEFHNPSPLIFFENNFEHSLQLIHRFMAILFFIFVVYLYLNFRKAKDSLINKYGLVLLILVIVQLIIGLSNALFGIPILISLLHSITATLITLFLSLSCFRLR